MTQEQREELYAEWVKLKRQASDINKRTKELKQLWVDEANTELADSGGLGKIAVMEVDGKELGVKFSEKKSSVSVTKLKAEGVDPDVIDACTGTYIAVDLF